MSTADNYFTVIAGVAIWADTCAIVYNLITKISSPVETKFSAWHYIATVFAFPSMIAL